MHSPTTASPFTSLTILKDTLTPSTEGVTANGIWTTLRFPRTMMACTIDFSLEAASNPWEVTWNLGVVLITTSVHMYGAPYDTDGEYKYALTYNSFPVYQFDDPEGYTDSIYIPKE